MIEQILCYSFSTVTTISYSFFASNKQEACMQYSFVLVEVTHCCYHYCWNTAPTASLCSHPLFDIHQCSASIDESVPFFFFFFFMEGFNDTPLLSLLPCVTWQQNVMGYWWEGSTSTAVPPTSTSDVVGQRNKIEGSTLGAALVCTF